MVTMKEALPRVFVVTINYRVESIGQVVFAIIHRFVITAIKCAPGTYMLTLSILLIQKQLVFWIEKKGVKVEWQLTSYQ